MAQHFWLLSFIFLLLRRTAALDVSSASNSSVPTASSSHISTSASEAAAILSGLGGSPSTTATASAVPSSSVPLPGTISNGSYSIPETKTHTFKDPSVFTVHANATDARQASQAMQCWSSIITWSKQSQDWYNSDVATHTWPISLSTVSQILSNSWTSVYYPNNASVYTLCDGKPRANGIPITSSGVSTTSYTPVTVKSAVVPTFRPQPCEATPDNCRFWYQNTNILDEDDIALLSQCGNPAHGVGDCIWKIQGDVQLYYFPVTTANGSFCSSTRPTITQAPAATVTNVMTVGNYTFTSGYAYIRVSSLWAGYDDWSQRVGPSFKDIMLTVKSEDVSSQCQGDFTNTPLNFADLNWPVPASAYSCQDPCVAWSGSSVVPTQCSTIWSNVNPWLAIPTKALKELAPEWSTCIAGNKLQPMYWFDPPIVLEHVADVATPTAPVVIQTDPAAPQSSPKSPLASQTASASTSNSVVTQPPIPASSNAANPQAESSGKPAQLDSPSQQSNPLSPQASSSSHPIQLDPPSEQGPDTQPQEPASTPSSSSSLIPPSPTTIANIILGTQTIPAIPGPSNNAIILGTLTTLSQNQALTLSNIPISISGSSLVVGSTQFAIPSPSPTSPQPDDATAQPTALTLADGTHSLTAPLTSNGALQLDPSQTLMSGGAAVTIPSNGVFSYGSEGLVFVPSTTGLVALTFSRVGGSMSLTAGESGNGTISANESGSLPSVVTSFPSVAGASSAGVTVWTGDPATTTTSGSSSGGSGGAPTVTMGSGAQSLRRRGRGAVWGIGVIGVGIAAFA